MYVKVVYSRWDWYKGAAHRSLVMNDLAISYEPSVWAQSKVEGTRLFMWNSLLNAIQFHGHPRYAEAYMGPSFWWAEGTQVKPMLKIIKDPPVSIALKFWANWWSMMEFQGIPWIYQYRLTPIGVVSAEKVRLVQMVSPEEFEKLGEVRKIDYDEKKTKEAGKRYRL